MPSKASQWSVVHGDLNASNIILSSTGEIALIDFADAGLGHCYEDMITIESAVRLCWPLGVSSVTAPSIGDYFERELRFNRNPGDSEFSGDGWPLIRRIRELTGEAFGNKIGKDYYYGLSFYCFRLPRIPEFQNETKKRILATGIAAAMIG
ncbi:MAG: phosphotransferase family protein [Methylocella sp.]